MALIKCPSCGKDISDKAEKCVSCGYDMSNKKKKKGIKFLILGIVIIFVIIAMLIILLLSENEDKEDKIYDTEIIETNTETEITTESEDDKEKAELKNKMEIFSEISDNVMGVDETVTDVLNDMQRGSDIDYYYNVFVGAKTDLKTAKNKLEDSYDLCGDISEFETLKRRINKAKGSLPTNISSNSSEAVIDFLNDMEQFCYDLADVEEEMANIANKFDELSN